MQLEKRDKIMKEELTFPDCPTCNNMQSMSCIFSNICKIRVLDDGTRCGIPSHHVNKTRRKADTY